MLTTDRLSSFVNFMVERENIRIKKELGQPWPWTDDPILQTYKFTNVHRSDDRTSRGFLKIYDLLRPNRFYYDILYACGVLRYFGTLEFGTKLTPQELTGPFWRDLILRAGTMRRAGEKVFTSAYVITNGGRSEPKEVVVVDYLSKLWDKRQGIASAMALGQSWKTAYDILFTVPGFGGSGFMAKEVLQDFLMVYPNLSVLDRDTWTPMGPGARRGMNRMQSRELNFRQPENKFIEECQQLRELVNAYWPAWRLHQWKPLTAHDVQFQLCEFDKYSRVLDGTGTPKARYHRG